MWIRKHCPEDYARAELILMMEDYILYLLTGDVSPEERFAIQKKYDTPEDYTFDLPDQERMEGCEELVAQSRLIREQCQQYGLRYYETAREREAVFQEIMASLESRH